MRPLHTLLRYLAVALVAAGLLLLDVWPRHPTSWHAWLLFVALALPALLLVEWLAEGMLTNPLSKSVDRATAHSSFSWLRIGYVLALAIFVLALLLLAQHLWSN